MSREKAKDVILILLLIILATVITVVFLRYVLGVILPFAIAYITVHFSDRIAKILSAKRAKVKRPTRLAVALLSLSLIVLAAVFFVRQICILAFGVISELLEGDNLMSLIKMVSDPIVASLGGTFPEKISEVIIEALRAFLSSIVSNVGLFVTNFAASLPKVFLSFVITVISVIYLSVDLERIEQGISELLTPRARVAVCFIRKKVLDVGISYLRSYALIMTLTFSVVLFGFIILSVKNAVTLALLIAVLDLLPIIGVGTVIVPWGIFALVSGDIYRGVGLIILFIVNEIIRQYSEPKIVGKNLNMHPLLTLILIYGSVSLLGVRGVLLVPILAVVIAALAEYVKPCDSSSQNVDKMEKADMPQNEGTAEK